MSQSVKMVKMVLRILMGLLVFDKSSANPDAKRLYSNLLANYDR